MSPSLSPLFNICGELSGLEGVPTRWRSNDDTQGLGKFFCFFWLNSHSTLRFVFCFFSLRFLTDKFICWKATVAPPRLNKLAATLSLKTRQRYSRLEALNKFILTTTVWNKNHKVRDAWRSHSPRNQRGLCLRIAQILLPPLPLPQTLIPHAWIFHRCAKLRACLYANEEASQI